MCAENIGGFAKKPTRCPQCKGDFMIEPLPPYSDKNVRYCPYCGEPINQQNNDDLIKEIREELKKK